MLPDPPGIEPATPEITSRMRHRGIRPRPAKKHLDKLNIYNKNILILYYNIYCRFILRGNSNKSQNDMFGCKNNQTHSQKTHLLEKMSDHKERLLSSLPEINKKTLPSPT